MDKRTIITIVLCMAVFIVWGNFIAPLLWPAQEQPLEPERPVVERPADAAGQDAQPRIDTPETAPPAPDTRPPPVPTIPDQQAVIPDQKLDVELTTLENEYLRLELTNEGGTITAAYLKEFDEDVSHNEPLRLLAPITPGRNSLALQFVPAQGLAGRRFNVLEADGRSVTYQTALPNGLRLTKVIELPEGKYHALVTVKLGNASGKEIKAAYWITSAAGIVPDLAPWQKQEAAAPYDLKSRYIEGAVGAQLTNGQIKVIKKASGKVQDAPFTYDATAVDWVGVKNRYFSAVLRPRGASPIASGRIFAVGENNVGADLERLVDLQPNGAAEDEYIFFIGPNRAELLENPAYSDFAGLHGVPWPAPVTKLFIGILHAFYGVAANYGVAIIMLTLLVRAALHPLTRKSQKSMHGMQKLGPKMKEIKEKYKDDKKRQQEEMMKLYREHGVNPMGGCLPIILQLPILIGLFGALRSSIELRHAPFCLWMKDLSQPDALAMLPRSLPFVGGGPLNVLPILMIVAMVLQQKLTPKPAADAQAEQTQKMMMWMMPAMFGLLFYGMPSGLVLYFMTSTGLGVLESHLVRRHMSKLDTLPATKSTRKKKETWVDRAARAKATRSRKLK